MECNLYDVLFKCILLSSIETSGWTIQNVKGRYVWVFTNDLLQCQYSTVYKAGERAQQYLPDVIDPTRAVCADYSQGNEAVFSGNAGKQCVAMSATCIIYHHLEDVSLWTASTLNDILVVGNNLYSSLRYSVETNGYLLLTVPFIVSIYVQILQSTYHYPFSALNWQLDSSATHVYLADLFFRLIMIGYSKI